MLWGSVIAGGSLTMAFHWASSALADLFELGPVVIWPLFAAMIFWESIPVGMLCALFAHRLARRPPRLWIVPVAAVCLEYFFPRIFPWSFAHTQTQFLPMLQVAELVGATGVTFCIVYVALIPAAFWRMSHRSPEGHVASPVVRDGLMALATLVAVLGFGYQRLWHWSQADSAHGSIRTAIVQVDPRFDSSLAEMRQRTAAFGSPLDVVCWPESSLGTYHIDLKGFGDPDETFQNAMPPRVDAQPTIGVTAPVLAGGKSYPTGASETGPFMQTAFLVATDQSIAARYFKQKLMPMGEYIPGQSLVPALRELADLDEMVSPADGSAPLALGNGARLGVLMCYEDMLPDLARRSVAGGADVLITLANGSAFENPLTLEQHMRLALLRAVENRRYFVRCTATGVSAVISPTGEIVQRTACQGSAGLVADLPLLQGRTVHNRLGAWFPVACLAILAAFLLRPLLPSKKPA
jgi:apolipoprotein N-acyltransferase